MDNRNNESTSTSVETNNNAWQLVIPSRDDIESAQSDFKNEVVDEANDELREIRQLIKVIGGSDWGEPLVY